MEFPLYILAAMPKQVDRTCAPHAVVRDLRLHTLYKVLKNFDGQRRAVGAGKLFLVMWSDPHSLRVTNFVTRKRKHYSLFLLRQQQQLSQRTQPITSSMDNER